MENCKQRRTNVHAHLPIVFDCCDVKIKCGQKVAQIENNGLGRWLNGNLNRLLVIAIWHIELVVYGIGINIIVSFN